MSNVINCLCPFCNKSMWLFVNNLSDDRYGFVGKFDIYRCRICGFGQTFPKMDKSQISNLYTNYYPRKDFDIDIVKERMNFEWNYFKKMWVWWIGENNVCHYLAAKGEVVLDVGCGDGTSLVEMLKMDVTPFGTEQDRNVVKIANKLNLNIFIGDLDKYPKKYMFDRITGSQVIEHQGDPVKFLFGMKHLLKVGGKIVVSFPNIDGVYRRIFGRRWINWHVPYHQSFLTKDSMLLLADKSGMKIESWKTVTPTMWTMYQLMSFFVPSDKRVTKLIWSGSKDEKINIRFIILKLLYNFLKTVMVIFYSPINKVLDITGAGDSVIVVLDNKL